MKLVPGTTPAQLEITVLHDRLEFRIFDAETCAILQTEPADFDRTVRKLRDFFILISTNLTGRWTIQGPET
jgi:hypothetical protein